jgi:hypothetical protein
MNTRHVGYKANAFGARKLAFLFLVIVLLMPTGMRWNRNEDTWNIRRRGLERQLV